MEQQTKIILLSGIAALTTVGQASAEVCSAAIAAKDSAFTCTVAGDTGSFIVNTATFSISANVNGQFKQTATAFAVQTATNKGMHTFGASSSSTSVSTCESTSVSAPSAKQPAADDNPTSNGCK